MLVFFGNFLFFSLFFVSFCSFFAHFLKNFLSFILFIFNILSFCIVLKSVKIRKNTCVFEKRVYLCSMKVREKNGTAKAALFFEILKT